MIMAREETKTCKIDTVVIGGGQAGLCMSHALQEEGRDHVVLEKRRALEQWRSVRWDSFMMNTPLAHSRIMGQKDGLPDELMSIPLEKNIQLWDDCIKERKFSIREQAEVVSVRQDEDGHLIVKVKSDDRGPQEYKAKNVVAAPGNYQLPNIPECASNLGADIQQLRVGTYTNPSAIRDGAILVVGGGQTGMQLGEELLQAGRKVFIATSRVKGSLRSYRGEDIFFWLDRTGMLTMPKEALPDPNMKYDRIPIAGNNHPISHYSLARMGAEFLGGLESISKDGATAIFKDNLQENIAFAQGGYDFLFNALEGWIAEHGKENDYPPHTPEPEWEPHQPLLEYTAPTKLILRENDIGAVLWATGWNADLSWLHIDEVRQELGPDGRPEACDTSVPGFFWLGFHWLRFLNSGNGNGFHHDAPYIASKLR
jgi:putative flavoprotein involved in K+ transport